jgi:hypothetical protein
MDAPPKSSTSRNEPRLLDQVRAVIPRFHYSIRTEKASIDWIRRFILFHQKRHPSEMGAVEARWGGHRPPKRRRNPCKG